MAVTREWQNATMIGGLRLGYWTERTPLVSNGNELASVVAYGMVFATVLGQPERSDPMSTIMTRPVNDAFVPFPVFGAFVAWGRSQVRTPALDRFAAPSMIQYVAPNLATYLCACRNVAGWWV
jgi:hypothetical protein